ncbi:unnamed protein product [Schistosoma haematobium]|nr:unnamed protein product [Schistosoma haematobium]
MKTTGIDCGNKTDQISDWNLESSLNSVVSRVPGSFWWFDTSSIESDGIIKRYYWLRIPAHELSTNFRQKHNVTGPINIHSTRLLARLLLLHYNESINISGVQLTPQNPNQIICIDCYVPQNGGHWKVIWSDLRRNLELSIASDKEHCDVSKKLISGMPIQLGPGLRLIGWASGHSYSSKSCDDTLPGCETHSWCFVMPINIDHLYNVTVLLLLPEIKDVKINTPTHPFQSTGLGGSINDINLLNTDKCQPFATKQSKLTQIRESQFRKNSDLYNNNCNFSFTSSLLGFGSKLAIITQPDNYQGKLDMSSISVDSICSLDALDYRCRVGDKRKFCQYTYIKTQSGTPAYKNGAFIGQLKNERQETNLEYDNQNKLFNDQPFILDHIKEMNLEGTHFVSCMKHNVTINCDSTVVSKAKNENGFNSKCYAEIYPLEGLEVVCSKQTISPFYLSKCQKSQSISNVNHNQSGSDQSALYTTNSDLAISISETDQFNSQSLLIDVKQQTMSKTFTAYSVFSNPTEEYENRTNLLNKLLGELNLLSQIILNLDSNNNYYNESLCNYDIHELCKCILQDLTELHNDEEDEEDICDHEFMLPPSRLPITQHKEQIHVISTMNTDDNNMTSKQNTNDLSAICVPLPDTCRVKSPVPLLVFYFEILSELMELKDYESKCSEDDQNDLSSLMDISAGILRLLDVDTTNSKNESKKYHQDSTVNLSTYKKCDVALHTLIQLQDAWIAAPVLIEMLNTLNINESNDDVINNSKEFYETIQLYLTRIQSALNVQRHELKTLISNDLCLILDKPVISFSKENTVENFEYLCGLVVDSSLTDELESEKQLFLSIQCNSNELFEKILQSLEQLPLPLVGLWKQRKKLCTSNYSSKNEKQDEVDKNKKSFLGITDGDNDDDDDNDHKWEQFYEFNKLYLKCLTTYLNEVKCFVTTVSDATPSQSQSITMVKNDNVHINSLSQSFNYPTMHLSLLNNCNLLNTNWQQEQINNIDKEREILQENFNELRVLADFLHVLSSSSSSSSSSLSSSHSSVIKTFKQRKIWEELINEMRSTSSRAFEQYTCLGFLKQIIRRPGGLWDLSHSLIELFNQLENASQSHSWTELELYNFELSIRHLSHQIWIELTAIDNLSNEYFNKTENIGITDWLEAWIYRLQEIYRLVINQWTEKMHQYRNNVQIHTINDWCDYVSNCIGECKVFHNLIPNSGSSPSQNNQQSKKYQFLDKEFHFAILWSLLCDADIIQEKCNVQLETSSSLTSKQFTQTLQELKRYLNIYIEKFIVSSMDNAKSTLHDSNHNLITLLLKQLEYSLHYIPDHYRVFSLELIDNTFNISHQSDQLRVMLQQLKHLRNLCERNYLLCNQSLSLLHKISFSNLNQYESNAVKDMLRLLTTWSYGYFVIHQSLERVIRAGGVTESERYPLRALITTELRSEATQMLKQKQAFIEAVHFGLETITLQAKSLSNKLHEYDSNSKLANIKIQCENLFEQLKHLYYKILEDDRLKITNRAEIPDHDLNCLVIARKNQIMELMEFCRKIDQINWINSWEGLLEYTNELTSERGYFKLWIIYFLQQFQVFSSKINLDEIFLCQINQMEEIIHDWSDWLKKYIWPLPFPYPKNYAWTPIIMSIHPSINMKSRHIEYEKSLKMDCQNAGLKFSHKFMNLSNFYYNHIKNKSLIKNKGIDENYNGIYNNLQENKLNYSMELLDVNYPNEFLQEIHHLYKLTLSSVSSPMSSSASLSSSNGISSKFIRSTFTNEQVICQCDILQSAIINRLLEIQSCLVYGDQLTLMMIEQIMFDLFEIQLPNQSILEGDSKSHKLWMNIYSDCMKYLRNGFTKSLCALLTSDSKSNALNNLQFVNEFDIPGSPSFSKRWQKKLQIDKLEQHTSESEKQFPFFIHLIILYNLYDTWQSIVKIAGTIITSKESTVYNPVLLQWILTTRPKFVEAILAYPIIQLSHNYQCSQCLCKSILDTFLSIDEVQLNNLFREFSSQYGCIDYLLLESVHNLNDRITLCIQKIDAYHLQLRNIAKLKLPNGQDTELTNNLLKNFDHVNLADSNTLTLRHALSHWSGVLIKKLANGHNFKRRLTYCSDKLNSLLLNLKSAKTMETDDYVEIEKRLSHLQVIMDQLNKLLNDLQTIPFQASINYSIDFIHLINQLLIIRQQNLVQHILTKRLNYYLSKLHNDSICRRLLHLCQLGTTDCKQIIEELICILHFTGLPNSSNIDDNDNDKSKDFQYIEKPLFRMHVKSPGPGGFEQLFCKLSMVDKYCTEAQGYLRQSDSLFPLKSISSYNDNKQMIDSKGSENFLNELTNELVTCILSTSVVKRKIKCLIEKSEKLRNVLSAFEDNANEMNAFRDQLCIAVPQLTGYHLSNLIKAVDHLEILASRNLNESYCPTDPVEKRHPELGGYLKHAGQRLMELETCLEHSREAASILIYFEYESQFWSTSLTSLTSKNNSNHEALHKRGLLLQSKFKNSPIAIKLHTAWVKLTQLGDRLGRIQAGLPVRPSETNGVEHWHHLSPTQTQSHLSTELRTKLMKSETKRISKCKKDYSDVLTTEFPYVSADTLRRKQTNLRDALGSHMCVHPDCKISTGECLSPHTQHNESQLNIQNKIEWIFKKLINLHTYLQNDYSEALNREEFQRQRDSISKSELCDLVKYARRLRWHKSHSLQSEYQELKNLITELVKSKYPKIAIIQEYFQSLEELWFGVGKSQENLNSCTDEARSYSRLSIPQNEPEQYSIKSINAEIQGNNIHSKQYIPTDASSYRQSMSSHSTTLTSIPNSYHSMLQDYTTPLNQDVNDKPSNNDRHLVEKQTNSSYDDECCDWTWREMTTHGLDPQPLVFPSSANTNPGYESVNRIKTYDPTNTVDLQLKNETDKFSDDFINRMISELSSTTSSFQKISSNINGNSSEILSIEEKNTLSVDNKTPSNIHNHEIKLLPNNNSDSSNQLPEVISPNFNHRNSVLQFNKLSIEVPLLSNNVERDFEIKSHPLEIHSHSELTNSMTDDTHKNSCTSTLTMNSKLEYNVPNRLEASHKPDKLVPSNNQISYSIIDHVKLKPINICVNDKTSKVLIPNNNNNEVLLNTQAGDSLIENTSNEKNEDVINRFSPNTTLDSNPRYESTRNNSTLSNRQLQTFLSNITSTTISNIDKQSEFHDVNVNGSIFSTSVKTTTTTTISINLTEHKLKSDQKEINTETMESCLPTSFNRTDQSSESLFSIPQTSSIPNCLHPTFSTVKNLNMRKTFNEIYQCRHLGSSSSFHEGNNVIDSNNNINSMCGLCDHMSNLHTLISNLQSHLLSNRQNRLSNLLPIDVQSFTLTSSSISSLSTYWSPIIKEYLSILCEIKSELDSFQPSVSITVYKTIYLPVYKSMIDLLNLWNCRLHDFLCLRSSNSSKSGVDISQTRWLTLFISLIQHNEIQVEHLKSLFTGLLHDIENEDNESMKSDLNIDNNDDKSFYLSRTIQDEDNSFYIRRDSNARLNKSSRNEYLNDLKTRLFSCDFDDQHTVQLSLQQPSSLKPLITFPNEKMNHSFQTQITKIDSVHKPSTVVTTSSIHEETYKDKEQTDGELSNFDQMSFEQYLCNLPQNITGKVVSSISSTDKTFTQETTRTTKVSEFKEDIPPTNQITTRKDRIKKTRKRKLGDEEFSEKYDNGDINRKDTCNNNIVNNKPCALTYLPRMIDNAPLGDQMLKNDIDIDGVNHSDEQLNLSLYSSSSVPNRTKSYNASQILVQESDEVKNAVIQNNKVMLSNNLCWSSSEDNRMTSLGNESTETNDLTNINDTVKHGGDLEAILKSDEMISHPNKSDNSSPCVTLQLNNPISVTDSNAVTSQCDRHSVDGKLKSSHHNDKQMPIRVALPDTRLLKENDKSYPHITCNTSFSPEETPPVVEVCTALKSEQDAETNKTNKQICTDNPTSISLESAKLLVKSNTNRDRNIETSHSSKFTENTENNNDKAENDSEEISDNISRDKRHFPPMDSVQHDKSNKDYECLSSSVSKTTKDGIRSYQLKDDIPISKVNPPQSDTDAFVKTTIKIISNNTDNSVSSPSSLTSNLNKPINDPHKFTPANKKLRKANRKAANNHRIKRVMTGNLKKPTEINGSTEDCPISQPESFNNKQSNISVQSERRSKLDNDSTSHSPSTQEILTTEIPTTISLKPGLFEKYQIRSGHKKTQPDYTDQNEFDTSDHQHCNCRPNTESLLVSPTLIDCTNLYDQTTESSLTAHDPSVISIENEKRKTDTSVRLELTYKNNGNSYLFKNKLDTKEIEQSKSPLTDTSYQMAYLNNPPIDIKHHVYKKGIQMKESSVSNLMNTSNQYSEIDLLKNNFLNQSEHVYHQSNDENLDKNIYDHQYHDKHNRQHNLPEHAKHPQVYRVENVHVLRKIPMMNQYNDLNKKSSDCKRINNDIHDQVNLLPVIFNSERLTSDSLITNKNCLESRGEQQAMSINMARETDLRGSKIITVKNKSQRRRRCCRSLPCLLLLLPLIFLLLSLFCIFILPDCPLFLSWFMCNEKHPIGEWIYSPIVFHEHNPPF